MKLLALLNGRARDGGEDAVREQLQRAFFRHQLRIEAPESVEQAGLLLRSNLAEEADVVVVAGGDGTVNVALQALGTSKNQDKLLGILPCGTANDLADALDLPRDLEHACEVIKIKQVHPVDVITVKTGASERLFVTSGGSGLAADVAVDTNRFKTMVGRIPGLRDVVKSLGKELYQLFLLPELAFPHEHVRKLHLRTDNGELDVETALVMINNQPVVGGSFRIAPHTKHDDGRFCVSVFLDKDGAALALATAAVRQGRSPGTSSLLQLETAHLVIEAKDGNPVRFFGDGELLADTRAPLELAIERQARVLAP